MRELFLTRYSPDFGFSYPVAIMMETEVSIMTLTHFKENERQANPRAAMVRVEIRDAQGYANQRRHDLRVDERVSRADLEAVERLGRAGVGGGEPRRRRDRRRARRCS